MTYPLQELRYVGLINNYLTMTVTSTLTANETSAGETSERTGHMPRFPQF